MDPVRLILPHWRVEYRTALDYDQLGQRLLDNVLTGFSFYSPKRYYGKFEPGGFSVRRVWSRIKQMSFAPTVKGEYRPLDNGMSVTLDVAPHPVWLTIFLVCVVNAVFFWIASLPLSRGSVDIGLMTRGVLPLAVVYLVPWLAFRASCAKDLRFWEGVLQLEAIPRATESPN